LLLPVGLVTIDSTSPVVNGWGAGQEHTGELRRAVQLTLMEMNAVV